LAGLVRLQFIIGTIARAIDKLGKASIVLAEKALCASNKIMKISTILVILLTTIHAILVFRLAWEAPTKPFAVLYNTYWLSTILLEPLFLYFVPRKLIDPKYYSLIEYYTKQTSSGTKCGILPNDISPVFKRMIIFLIIASLFICAAIIYIIFKKNWFNFLIKLYKTIFLLNDDYYSILKIFPHIGNFNASFMWILAWFFVIKYASMVITISTYIFDKIMNEIKNNIINYKKYYINIFKYLDQILYIIGNVYLYSFIGISIIWLSGLNLPVLVVLHILLREVGLDELVWGSSKQYVEIVIDSVLSVKKELILGGIKFSLLYGTIFTMLFIFVKVVTEWFLRNKASMYINDIIDTLENTINRMLLICDKDLELIQLIRDVESNLRSAVENIKLPGVSVALTVYMLQFAIRLTTYYIGMLAKG